MAVDWWMLENLETPTLRFYQWDRPTISIGYRQQRNPPDELRRPDFRNLNLVVRPTGGGYLYHDQDLSYSIVLPSDHPITNEGIRSSYETLCTPFLREALEQNLLPEPDWGTNDEDVPNCLDAPAGHEPTVDGAKWMASAQVRRKRALLQHGSLFWNESWPEELSGSRPHFLSSTATEPSLSEYRDGVTRRLARSLHEKGTARPLTLTGETWERIHERAEQFRVESLGKLPTFRRYSDP